MENKKEKICMKNRPYRMVENDLCKVKTEN